MQFCKKDNQSSTLQYTNDSKYSRKLCGPKLTHDQGRVAADVVLVGKLLLDSAVNLKGSRVFSASEEVYGYNLHTYMPCSGSHLYDWEKKPACETNTIAGEVSADGAKEQAFAFVQHYAHGRISRRY
jgi:hypothetical protein